MKLQMKSKLFRVVILSVDVLYSQIIQTLICFINLFTQ